MSTALATVAADIRTEHDAAQVAARDAVKHAIRAGELLIEAKAALPHGKFGAWLAANVEFSARTAQGYIQLAKLDGEKRNAVADLSLRSALTRVSREAIEEKRREAWNRPVPIAPVSHIRRNGQPVTVKHIGGNKWAVETGPNDVGRKLNPIAWNEAEKEAERLPELARERTDLNTANREVKFLEHELRRAQKRQSEARNALRHAAWRYLESMHGVPAWGSWSSSHVTEEITASLLRLSPEELVDAFTRPDKWDELVGDTAEKPIVQARSVTCDMPYQMWKYTAATNDV